MISDAKVYTDVQSLEHLKYTASHHPGAAKNEIAKQFESLLLQQMLKSMRDANKVFDNDLFSSDQMDFYEDMYDKQLTLSLSEHGLGIAEMINKNIEDHYQSMKDLDLDNTQKTSEEPIITQTNETPKNNTATPIATKTEPTATSIHSPEDFINRIWTYAKDAAKKIGVNPKVLMAQAALETNWGKNILSNAAQTSHNLFNIKAGLNWDKSTISATVLEEKAGVMVSEKAKFKNYSSFAESFHDYINLLTTQDRYREVVKNAADPQAFITTLQKSGFATDKDYANKVMHILSSGMFKKLTAHLMDN